MRVLVRSLVLALALGAIPLSTVAAHECIVANRSDTGNEHAGGSKAWVTVSLTDIFESTEQFGLPDLTSAQVAHAVGLAGSTGVPDSFTIRGDKLIGGTGEGWTRHGQATDDKGIDHFFEIYGDRLLGALFAALGEA
jgi:hypothetical protein